MSIQLTGHMRVAGPDGVAESAALAGRQGRLVLASLAVADDPLPREVLADRVWGDRLPRAWAKDLSAVVSRLRAALGRVGLDGAAVLVGDGATYQLRPPPDLDVDVRRAPAALAAAGVALDDGRPDEATALAQEAAAIAGRTFLAGEDAPWVDEVRAELGRVRLAALETAARAHAAAGRGDAAAGALAAVLVDDPLRETAARALMQVHLDAGDRAAALRTFEAFRSRLADDLGVDPSPETARLHRAALGADEAPPAPRPVPEVPEVRYTRSGDVTIAYQVVGDGPVDVIAVPGWTSNLEVAWQEPALAGFLRELAAGCRLVLFDKRGTGLSDPIPLDAPPPLEVRMDDVTAVMDAVGSERAVLFGFSEGGTMSLLFAATHPDRTLGLLLWGTWARQLRDDEFPYGWTPEEGRRRFVMPILERGAPPLEWFVPSQVGNTAFESWFATYARQSASPGMSIALLRANAGMDVRAILPTVRVPTLVLHRTEDVLVEVGQGRYIAEHVPGARLVEFTGRDHWPWLGSDRAAILAEMRTFVERVGRSTAPTHRVLTTLVRVRGLDSPGDAATALAAEHRGVVVDGDGVVVRFDGPGRAVTFARAVVDAVPGTSAGVHTGEVELRGGRVTGPAVDVATGVAEAAAPARVLVTRTVVDLVAGSPLVLEPSGEVDLGERGSWPVASPA